MKKHLGSMAIVGLLLTGLTAAVAKAETHFSIGIGITMMKGDPGPLFPNARPPHQKMGLDRVGYHHVGRVVSGAPAQRGNNAKIEPAAFRNHFNRQIHFTCCDDKVVWQSIVGPPIECDDTTIDQWKVSRCLVKFTRGSVERQHRFSNRINGCCLDDGEKFD